MAKLLLRSGITYQQFESAAKRAFVAEASSDTESRSRPTNTSRIAVRTGLSRKEVRKIREQSSAIMVTAAESIADRSGPLARVLHAWHVDRRFLTDDGKPRDLDFQDEAIGFNALVRSVAGDVPPGAVRTELRRAGAVIELDDGRLRATKRYYVPGNVGEKAITVLSGMVFPLTSGIVHNSDPGRTEEGFIQRFAFSQNLPSDKVAEFRQWSRQDATTFIERMDDWLAQHETNELNVETESSLGTRTVGIGVFYYEGPSATVTIGGGLSAAK